MESDRGAVLTVRAASRGVIDFRQARLLDPEWWRHCHLMFRGMVWDDDLKIQEAVFKYHLALVGNSGLTDESFKEAQTNAKDGFYDMLGLLRPWAGISAKERQEKEIESLKAAYEEAFGESLDDPDFIQREREAVAEWKAERSQQRADYESDEERILRLRKEANQKIERLRREQHERRKQGR